MSDVRTGTAGLVEIFLGVRAERRGLEDIAQPLTAVDAAPGPGRHGRPADTRDGAGARRPGREES